MGLPQPVAAACRDISDDHQLRSSEVVRRALAAISELIESTDLDGPEELLDLTRSSAASLARARPSFGSLANALSELNTRIVRVSGQAEDLRSAALGVVSSYGAELERAGDDVARHVARLVGPEKTILAASCGRSVVDGICRGRARKVLVPESRPGLDGRLDATRLAEEGIVVEVTSDAAAPTLVRDADLVLLGAVSVLADGAVVARIGSYGIGLAAERWNVPLFVVAETLKVSPVHATPRESRPSAEIWQDPPRGIAVVNPAFDLIPPGLMRGIVIERGIIVADEAARIAAQRRRGWRALGLS